MTFPNFFLAGPGKSGSTALYKELKQHPQIFLPDNKEPKFFAFEGQRPNYCGPRDEERINSKTIYRLEDYLKLFESVQNEKAIGDASPIYMYYPRTVDSIKKHVPNAKIIIMLRHPAKRVFSQYLHQVREGLEHLSFEEALQAEDKRIQDHWALDWQYKQTGFIAGQIERYLSSFPRKNVLFCLYEDFRRNNANTLIEIYDFLGVDNKFRAKIKNVNVSGIPKSRWFHQFLTRPSYVKEVLKPFIPKEIRRDLVNKTINYNLQHIALPNSIYNDLTSIFSDEIQNTQELTKLNLSKWLEKR